MPINLRAKRSLQFKITRTAAEMVSAGEADPSNAKEKATEAVAIDMGLSVAQLGALLSDAQVQTHRTIKIWSSTYQALTRLSAQIEESGVSIIDRLIKDEIIKRGAK